MERAFILLMTVTMISLMTSGAFASDDSGTFRGKWWNYYDRGVAYSEKDDSSNAIADLKKAASMRDKDQRMARTYGMHFIDYFPHRELGIVYFDRGEFEKAVSELEESIQHAESARANYFLNRARKALLMNKDRAGLTPPSIIVGSPADNMSVRDFRIVVRGRASGSGHVAKIDVGGNPYRFDLALTTVDFEKEISLNEGENKVVITAEDLLGTVSEKTIAVNVDREGPTINVYDLVAGSAGEEKTVKITGEVADLTGIRQLDIAGRPVKCPEAKSCEFSVSVSRISGIISIHAVDLLDNETRADMEIEKDLLAFSKKPAPVLLAFNGDKIFSFDKEAPVVKLKDTADIPAVFVDKYFVEGEVFDNKAVEKILVNGAAVAVKKGRKIFFSKTVKLNEGKNRLSVEAFDSSGNKGRSEFAVTRDVPDVMQAGARMSVTILPFEIKQKGTDLAQLAYERLIGSFVDQKRFNVIERTKLDRVLLEQKLTKAKLTDPEHSVKVGRLMSASAIVATSIKEGPKSVEIVSRVINTETSEVMEVKDVFSEDKSSSSVRELMDGLAAKVAAEFPVVEGMVVKKDHGIIYSDIGGGRSRIKKDTGIIIYRKGKEIKHPVTGKSLGWDTVKLGEGRIEDVQMDFSKIKILDKPSPQGIAVKDLVITK
jgi:curli biogenesis system outer membrane secretion channel CsgG